MVTVAAAFIRYSVARILWRVGFALTIITRLILFAIAADAATAIRAAIFSRAIWGAIGAGFKTVVIRWVGAVYCFANESDIFTIKLFQLIILAPYERVLITLPVDGDVSTARRHQDALAKFAVKSTVAGTARAATPIVAAILLFTIGLADTLIVDAGQTITTASA